MPDFTYEALSPSGERNTGTLTAGNDREAMAMLDARGMFPIKIQPAAQQAGRKFFGRVSGRHMATFYSQLADLLRTGVPLLRSLDLLERQSSNPRLAAVLREVRLKVADGTGLAQAMALHPRVFNELSVSMVRAGQEGGFLEDVLKRIADFTEYQEELKSKVIGSMAYPVFLATAGFVIVNVLIIFFVPRFEKIFDRLREKGELPELTTLLLNTSHFIQWNGWWVAILFGFGIYGLFKYFRTPRGRYHYDRLRLRIPVAGTLFLNLALARFTRILGTLLHNGIPILRALQIAKDSAGNKVLSEAIENSAANVTAGNSLAAPLGNCRYFPKDVVEMVAIAEESNTLETVLVDISNSLDKRTSRQLELFVRLLEPVMLMILAGVILVVVLGLLLPVFKMGKVAN
jgi:general secretion pathway protein F/type IV pilus assembly protein PilC